MSLCTSTNYASPIEKQLDFRFNLSTSSRNEGKCSINNDIHVTEVHVFESRGGTRPALEHLLGWGGYVHYIRVLLDEFSSQRVQMKPDQA